VVLGVITITRTAITVDTIVVIFAFIVSPFWYKNRLKRVGLLRWAIPLKSNRPYLKVHIFTNFPFR
jgi:hypothetical protein